MLQCKSKLLEDTMKTCTETFECGLADILAGLTDKLAEACPLVQLAEHRTDWFEQQDQLLAAGDSLDYDGPLTWAIHN